ncbi:MAG: TonB-dependent receptor, partial [Bacteroidaceae bacterium]|nr:TonB-dependent receptor [Bacteroidaceae bacterium]
LPGVNVYWKIVNEGVVTDAHGHYKIPIHESIHCLVFSCISYENDTVHHMMEPTHYDHVFDAVHILTEVDIAARQKASFISHLNPVAVQTITSEGLKRAACCSLAESFESNASVDVSYSDAVTGARQIELLGLSGLYTQMMAENMPNFRGLAATFGLNYVPGNWMNAILVSKGTSSVRHGYESISGQINVDFKKPDEDTSEKLFLNLYGNTMGMGELNFNTRWKMGAKGSMMLLGHVNHTFMTMDANGDSFVDDPQVTQYNVFARYNYANDWFEGMWGVKALKEDRYGGQLGFVHGGHDGPSADSLGFGINTQRYEAFSKTGFMFDKEETSLGLQQQFTYHKMHSAYFNTNWYHAEQRSYYANLLFNSYMFNTKHNYSVGASYSYDRYDEHLRRTERGHADQILSDSLYGRVEHVPGLYAEYVFNDDHHWSAIVGMRADYHSYYRKMLYTPRVHLRYSTHEHLTLRASAGKGYRSPNVLAENSTMMASARLIRFMETPKMEEAWNYGVNISKEFHLGARELTLQADFYRTDFVNQVVFDRDADAHEVRIYNLDGKSYSNCAQVEASCELFVNFDITMAFRYNDVKMTIADTLREKPFVNRYKGLLTLSYAPGTWQFDFTTQFNGDSRVPNLKGNATAVAAGQAVDRSPFYVIMNAQVTKKFHDSWEVYAGGENLTNYVQDHPIISADNPLSTDFDASMVWGPLSGIRAYLGVRYKLK